MSRELELVQDDKIEYPNNPPVTLLSPIGGQTVTDFCSAPLSRTMECTELAARAIQLLGPQLPWQCNHGFCRRLPRHSSKSNQGCNVTPPPTTLTADAVMQNEYCTQEIKSVLCFRISNPRYPRRLFGVPRETGSVRLRRARARPCKNHAPKSSQTSPAKALISSRFFCGVWGRGLSASSYRSSPGPRKGHFSMETIAWGFCPGRRASWHRPSRIMHQKP
jgi:hypothetical protein